MYKNKTSEDLPLLTGLWRYIQSPEYENIIIKKSIGARFWDIIKLLSLSVIVSLSLAFLIDYILRYTGYDSQNNAIVDLFLSQNIYFIFLFICIVAPIYEELAFRMSLRFSVVKFGLGLLLLLFAFYSFFQALYFDLSDETIVKNSFDYIYHAIIVIISGFLLTVLAYRQKESLNIAYRRHFKLIFYFFALAFSLMHLMNYTNLIQVWYFAPILILPQFLIGLLLGFVRMFYGLIWAMVYHGLYNLILITPYLLAIYLDLDLVNLLTQADMSDFTDFDQGKLLIASQIQIFIVIILLIAFWKLIAEFFKKNHNI